MGTPSSRSGTAGESNINRPWFSATPILQDGGSPRGGNSTEESSDVEQDPNCGASKELAAEGSGVNRGNGLQEARVIELLEEYMATRGRGQGNRRTVGPNTEELRPTEAEEQTVEKKSWKEVWKNKCEKKLPFLPVVFSSSTIEPTICKAMLSVGKLATKVPVDEATLKESVEESGKWFTAIRFSKLPGSAKTVWLTPTGIVQSHFRSSIMRAVLRAVKNNPRKYMYGGEEEAELHGDEPIPEWLGSTYMSNLDVDTVLERKQGKGTSKGRRLRKKQVKEGDASCYALDHLYSQLSKVLIYGRRRVDETWFSRIGYNFEDWSAMPVSKDGQVNYIDQSTLKILLAEGGPAAMQEKKLKDIPQTETGDSDSDESIIDARNNLQYEKAKLVCENLVVDIEHEVVVRERGVWVRKTETRRIEFLSLAVVMILSFSCVGTTAEMLRAHPDSLKKAAGLAGLLYTLVVKYKAALDATEGTYVTDLESITAGGLSMALLMPGKYRSKEIMRKGPCLIGESTGR